MMKKLNNAILSQDNNSTTKTANRERYTAPRIEVLEMEIEGAILNGSAGENGTGSLEDGGLFGN